MKEITDGILNFAKIIVHVYLYDGTENIRGKQLCQIVLKSTLNTDALLWINPAGRKHAFTYACTLNKCCENYVSVDEQA